MIRILLIAFILIHSSTAKSSTKALAENGKEVILFSDGTWKYSKDSCNKVSWNTDLLEINSNRFKKLPGATFLVKSNVFNVGVYMELSKWTFSSHKDNEKNPEYRFAMKDGDGYVLIITEKTKISLDNMRQVALINAQITAVDAREICAEYRIVNDKKVLCLKRQGTIKGIKFVYFGYYYSNTNGTIQLLGYTSEKLFDGIRNELENLLNGFVVIEK